MDRQHLNLPAPQVSLLHAVAAANPRVVVVLSAGSVVDLSWSHLAPGILHSYLSGQAGAEGVVDVRHYAVERGASDEEFATLLGLPLPEESPSTGIAADSPLSELRRARSPLARLAI